MITCPLINRSNLRDLRYLMDMLEWARAHSEKDLTMNLNWYRLIHTVYPFR